MQRIQVPSFRVLKDVDITFENEFTPRIFPLGSQNGGGKSTLLQLVFVLLHCSIYPERVNYLKNMLRGFSIQNNQSKRVLAVLDIWDNNKLVKLEFFSYKDNYIRNLISSNSQHELKDDDIYLKFSASSKLESINKQIVNTEEEIKTLERVLNRLESVKAISNPEERRLLSRDLLESLREYGIKFSLLSKRSTSIEFLLEVQSTLHFVNKIINSKFKISPIIKIRGKNVQV